LAAVTIRLLAASMAILAGCGGTGTMIYPHPPGEPGADPGPEITGVSCSNISASCEDVRAGSGEAAKAFLLATVRVTVDDQIDPPVRVGPREATFLHPPLGAIQFGGRERHLTLDMFANRRSSLIGERFFDYSTDALVGTWVVGMRRGGARRVRGRYTGTLHGVELPAGRDRIILIELVDFCYPTVQLGSRLRWSWADGSGSPLTFQPSLTVSGCGP
jgi:hypothetical protein